MHCGLKYTECLNATAGGTRTCSKGLMTPNALNTLQGNSYLTSSCILPSNCKIMFHPSKISFKTVLHILIFSILEKIFLEFIITITIVVIIVFIIMLSL
jgi:hypothetical protein